MGRARPAMRPRSTRNSCCRYNETTLGHMLRTSKHKKHRHYYADYDYLRHRLRELQRVLIEGNDPASILISFDELLRTNWSVCFDYYAQKLLYYERHTAMLIAQHDRGDGPPSEMERIAFERVYSLLHERVAVLHGFWSNNKCVLQDIEARRAMILESVDLSVCSSVPPSLKRAASHLVALPELRLNQRLSTLQRRLRLQYQKLQPHYSLDNIEALMRMTCAAKAFREKVTYFRCGVVMMLAIQVIWNAAIDFEDSHQAFAVQWFSSTSLIFQVSCHSVW
mgnify:CR=1 FL=1